jgi:hypothetical protein
LSIVNKFKDINWSPNIAERKQFALRLLAGFPCMGVGLSIIIRLSSGHWNFHVPMIVVSVGLAVAVLSWILPVLALPVYRVWYFLVCIIDTVVTISMLTLLFYLVMFPAGLVYRLFKGGPFRKQPTSARATYWEDVPPTHDVSRYYRQY